jgi:hypothetical protein
MISIENEGNKLSELQQQQQNRIDIWFPMSWRIQMENYDTHHVELLAHLARDAFASLCISWSVSTASYSAAGCKIATVLLSRTKVINFQATLSIPGKQKGKKLLWHWKRHQ